MAGVSAIMLLGFGLGLSVAAPIGPINIEIIRRGLRSGFREPFALGMGAVTADVIYLIVFCLGISRLVEFPPIRLTLLILGFLMLETLGVLALRDAARISQVPDAAGNAVRGGSLRRVYLLGIAMMVNPVAIAGWVALSSIITEVAAENPWAYLWFGISVPAGCTTWVVFIASVLHFGRRYVTVAILRAVNILGGVMLCGFGGYLLRQLLAGP